MDLLVEIFVMDAVSGITPFTLCSVEVTAVGSMIQDSGGSALDMAAINSAIDIKANTLLPTVVSLQFYLYLHIKLHYDLKY